MGLKERQIRGRPRYLHFNADKLSKPEYIPRWIREQRDPQGKAECDEFRARAKGKK